MSVLSLCFFTNSNKIADHICDIIIPEDILNLNTIIFHTDKINNVLCEYLKYKKIYHFIPYFEPFVRYFDDGTVYYTFSHNDELYDKLYGNDMNIESIPFRTIKIDLHTYKNTEYLYYRYKLNGWYDGRANLVQATINTF